MFCTTTLPNTFIFFSLAFPLNVVFSKREEKIVSSKGIKKYDFLIEFL